MRDITRRYFHIDVWFSGLPDPVSFHVKQEDMARFQGAYQNDRNSFFVCSTLDETDVAINLVQVEIANLYGETDVPEPKIVDAGDWLAIHTRNRQPFVCSIQDLHELAHVFTLLDGALTAPFEVIPLSDFQEGINMFDPNAVYYLEAPTSSVAKGKKQLLAKEQVDG